MSLSYRKEIDGLRALAVLPIVLFHAGFDAFGGGYVGVDIFFVISGFLITSIIRDQIGQGIFRFRDFYERRARRILPALFFVLLATLPAAWIWLLPREMTEFGASLLSVIAMVSNIFFWRDSGYFATVSEYRPLLHTWSLAVEEQFYLLFPALLFLLSRVHARFLIPVLATLGMASLALAQHAAQSAPMFGFYMLPTRIWEFIFGALAAVALSRYPRLPVAGSALAGEVAGLAGLGMIAYSILVFRKDLAYPSLWTAIPTLGTMLVILFANRHSMAGKLLSIRPLVAVGLISYSTYLWHQPVFAFARIRSIDPLPVWLAWTLVGLSLLLGYLTWRFVEPVWRVRLSVRKRSFFVALGLSAALLAGFAVQVQRAGGMPWRFAHLPAEYFSRGWIALKMTGLDNQQCYVEDMVPCRMAQFPDAPHNILLLGDSHASDFGHPFTKYLENQRANGAMFAVPGCAFLPMQAPNPGAQCGKARELVLALAAARKFDKYILVGNFIDHTNRASAELRDEQIASFEVFVQRLLDSGAQVELFEPRLSLIQPPGKAMALGMSDRIRPLAFNQDNAAAWRRAWERLARNPRFRVFSQDHALLAAGCGSYVCFNGHASSGYPLYRDVNHLTDLGAEVVFDAFVNRP